MKIVITINDANQKTTEDVLNSLDRTTVLDRLKKVFGTDSVDVQIVGGRNLVLSQLSDYIFQKNMIKGNPLFSGHSEIIRSYVESEGLSYRSQKVTMSQFFANAQNQSRIPKRIWFAALAKLRNKSGGEKYLSELRDLLMQLEPDQEFSY